MNLKDWEKLSIEEQQRRLDEKPIKRGKCAAGLLELRNSLKQEIQGESDASSWYSEAAAKLSHYKQGVKGDILRMMSTEEMMHYHMLSYIVDHITRECGE